ncbi:hypothetical protein [Mesorhizobium sp. CN2-181]|uniref:hypothetical protein n=1 Tax=Mesorhizobium yinganensis TaxID=3157707 RepID=UPI0032B79E3A
MKRYVTPTGSVIAGAYEMVPCTVGITSINLETGEPDYDGNGSKMHWDDQKHVELGGKKAYIDENGTAWPYTSLKEEEVDD